MRLARSLVVVTVFACELSRWAIVSPCRGDEPTGPRTPLEERESFRFADNELVAEAVLTEPDVEAPVAIHWDAAGRLYVVQMTDYPSGPGTGSVLQFTDVDGDGRYERRTCFVDGLPFPNGITSWNDGILVTAAPDIWFCRDRNGDGVADERVRLLTGFAEGNQQLRANGLYWGLDNWIYGANGRSDGQVSWFGTDEERVSIRRRDFRFRPRVRRFEPIAGHSQFGTAYDDWGRRFPVFNNLPVRQVVVEDRYLEAAPHIDWPESSPDITSAGDRGRVYALTPVNFYIPQPAGYSTSACGPVVHGAGGMGRDYRGDIFVCESAQNLVTRRELRAAGVQLVAERPPGEREREFLASTDPWFHPVFLATGPDGALWMVDFYRKVVEHPDWVVADLRDRIDWREGASHGRIWRIRRRDQDLPAIGRWPAECETSELVDLLEHENRWWRATAQRLLVQRCDASVADKLRTLLLSSDVPVTRVHALHVLDALSALDDELLASVLADCMPPLCEHGLVLAESRFHTASSSSKLLLAACALADHPDERLRFQLALSLGSGPATDDVLDALVRLARIHPIDAYQRAAILAAAGPKVVDLARRLFQSDASWSETSDHAQFRFLASLYRALGSTCSEGEIDEVAGWLTGANYSATVQAQLWENLLTGLQSRRAAPLAWRDRLAADDSQQSKTVLERLSVIAQLANDLQASPDARIAAVRVRAALWPESLDELRGTLVGAEPIELQQAVLAEMLRQPQGRDRMFDDWPQYSVAVRQQLLRAAAERPALAAECVRACQAGIVAVAEIEPATLAALRSALGDELRTQFNSLIDERVSSDRQAVVDAYRAAVDLRGDRVRGAAHFARLCLACHRLNDRGGDVGPNLSAIATHGKGTLLVEILDPSRQVLPDYAAYVCVTRDGRSLVGRIAAETNATVTIRRVGAPDQTVRRREIEELVATGKSVMPDGLETDLSVPDLADLLEFLQMPDARLLPDEGGISGSSDAGNP